MKTNLQFVKTPYALFFVVFFAFNFFYVSGQNYCNSTPVEVHGNLSVNGTNIVDQDNNPVSFAGNSFFWSNTDWEEADLYNANVVSWLKNDWNTTIVRAAMGVEEASGYIDDPAGNRQRVQAVVDAAIAEGLYVIIDWHSHNAQDFQAEAIDFFEDMATLYGNNPNVIYEIFNEPLQVSWSNSIKPYAEAVISAIRAIDPDNLIIVGTPTWSQDVDVASTDPITISSNIAYTLHFYAGTHGQSLRDKAQTALNNGIALMVTEWGSVLADGTGGPNEAETNAWMSFLADNDITHANWAISDKDEGASILLPGADPNGGWTASDLTPSGTLVKSIIENWEHYCPDVGAPSVTITNPQNNANVNEGDTVTIEVSANDTDGTISQVEFFVNGVSIGTDSTGPYSISWTPQPGTYVITAIATDNDSNSTTSSPVNVTVGEDVGDTSAYPDGIPHNIPGTINAVNFDIGGEGAAYHDTDQGNNGDGIRQDENVDTGNYTQGGSVGWIAGGEWLEFTVNVQIEGSYDVSFDVASEVGGSRFHLEFNGVNATGDISVPSTGGWNNYTTVQAQNIQLSAGVQTMRIVFNQWPFNIGNLYFTSDVIIDPGNCSFGAPLNNPLSTGYYSYSYAHVLGNGGPNLSNVVNFTINWDLQNNGLYQISFNTNNGQPNWWIDLRNHISFHGFNAPQPDITFSNTGIPGFDGEYWVTYSNGNFVLVSKNGGFTIYFSNSSSAPGCSTTSNRMTNTDEETIEESVSINDVSVYPNPSTSILIIDFKNNVKFDSLFVVDIMGRTVHTQKIKGNTINIPVSDFKQGIYILKLIANDKLVEKKFIKN